MWKCAADSGVMTDERLVALLTVGMKGRVDQRHELLRACERELRSGGA